MTEPPWFSMPSGNIISLPKLLETFQSVLGLQKGGDFFASCRGLTNLNRVLGYSRP